MKKIILSGIALGSCLLFASCGGTSENATIKNLSNQIDRLNNVVANVATVNTNEINLSNYSNKDNDTGAIKNIYQKTEASIKQQDRYKEQIFTKTASIKKALSSKDLQLGKNTSALKELTSSLSKYTTKLANTNNEYKTTAKTISRMRNNIRTTSSELGAKLTRLSSCADTRSCYYNNLLNTLNQIDSVLNGGASVQDNILNNDYMQNYLMGNRCPIYDTNGNCIQGGYCQDGNCYDVNGNLMSGYYFDVNGNCVNGNCVPNNSYVNNMNYSEHNLTSHNQMNNRTYNRNNMNNNYSYNKSLYNNNRYNGFNPDRNTDTYAPNISNIDTYRNNGSPYNYNNLAKNQGPRYVNNSNLNADIEAQKGSIKRFADEEKSEEDKNKVSNEVKTNDKTDTMNDDGANISTNVDMNEMLNKTSNNVQTLEQKHEENNGATNNNDTTTSQPTQNITRANRLSEDGRNDVDPKTQNLRHVERESIKNARTTNPQIQKTDELNTLNFNPDYKSSNKKIKDLIQSSSPVVEESFNHISVTL